MNNLPDFVFETSWEICNKIGGIYTVLSTKAKSIVNEYDNNYILVGPDVWKGTSENPDFIEDTTLFREWVAEANVKGLKLRVGRWNIEGKPLVILVDFTPLFSKKDEIFTKLWETHKLDSLSGEWDYIESAMFGYAAGQLIEDFTSYYLSDKNVVAHFHEWMTGTGVLYLNHKAPHIGTAFTTHATVLGRSIAGNGFALYENLETYNPDHLAREFNVVSKNSLESLAAQHADAFTTVSSITAKECKQFLGKEPDVITINGFEKGFVPKGRTFGAKRKKARKQALLVAQKVTGTTYADDSLLVINSGRYEFRNKGIDLFIKALGKLNKSYTSDKKLVAFIAVPSGHSGPINGYHEDISYGSHSTHILQNPDYDPVLKAAIENGLMNRPEDSVHLLFVPAYLNEEDGVINLSYYDFLIGFDLSVFPSYYEPWGYTPLESIAFKIPTLTTSVAGFGAWVNSNSSIKHHAVDVIERLEHNDEDAINRIEQRMSILINEQDNLDKTIAETQEVYLELLWEKLSDFYFESWSLSNKKLSDRKSLIPSLHIPSTTRVGAQIRDDRPDWKKILVQPKLPENLEPLKELAFNLWWSWNDEATQLFSSIDPKRWAEYEQNPVRLIESFSSKDIKRLLEDKVFMNLLEKVYGNFKAYMKQADDKPADKVAYFSMEYGLHTSLKIYSGGLGILAGDYLKQASDSNKNLFGIGLLYRHGYFKQSLSYHGDQVSEYHVQKFTQIPVLPVRDENGEWVSVKIALPGRTVKAKAWQVNVGRIPLFLLDTDLDDNNHEDRYITHQLYGGDNENRLKQEMVLGLGGVRLIKELALNPDIFHSNEGHSAFSGLERIKNLMEDEKMDFDLASEVVRATSLFTTHTPVPAGHDSFEEHYIRAYLSHFSNIFSLSWENFIGLGRFHPNNNSEKFSMSVLAAKLSREVNGVSRIHGRVSREMFQGLYPGYFMDELHIGHVTNGVHYFTWTDPIWQKLYRETFGKGFEENQPNSDFWKRIYEVPDKTIWQHRLLLKAKLVKQIKEKLKTDLTVRQENPKFILESLRKLKKEALIIGFARRFATYKRAHLLFTNLGRLEKIINKSKRPIFFVFAGKAHPNDKAGQDLIKRIIEVSKMPAFAGKILFLENYDMTLGKLLTSGVDIWLNTPTRPLEASGTSGEKAVMNGVANFSVLDGWWAEGYLPGAGWAIDEARSYTNQQYQDELDAEIIYNTLEGEIAKSYYNQNEDAVPVKWVSHIKKTIAEIAPHFTMQRMVDDYYRLFYQKLFDNKKQFYSNAYLKARELVAWKKKVSDAWDAIGVASLIIPDVETGAIEYGNLFLAEVNLNIPGLVIDDLGVEILMGNKVDGEVKEVVFKQELQPQGYKDGAASFSCSFPLQNSGVFDYTFRIFPKSDMLSHRMDFPLIKWV